MPEEKAPAQRISAEAVEALYSMVKDLEEGAGACGNQKNQAISEAESQYGLDKPAFNIAKRIRKTADKNPIKGRALYENVLYFCSCLKVDQIAAPSLFEEKEIRSGRNVVPFPQEA